MSASLTITFRRADADLPKNVILVIKDYSTDVIIVGAAVTVTGPNGYIYNGTTDALGKIYLGQRQPGQYSLVATATGYQSSDADFLANDTFTV